MVEHYARVTPDHPPWSVSTRLQNLWITLHIHYKPSQVQDLHVMAHMHLTMHMQMDSSTTTLKWPA